MEPTQFHASIVPSRDSWMNNTTGISTAFFHVRNAFVAERQRHGRWGIKLLDIEEEHRPTNMVVNFITPDSPTGWSASSISAREWSASNSSALGAVEALVFDIENPHGAMTLIPRDSRSLANGTRYRIQKTEKGYAMKVDNPDESPANYQDATTEAKYAMDIGVFMTEWAEEKRRWETAAKPGVFLTDYANNGLLKEKGSFKLTADHLPSGDPAPFRLKVPEFLPQHIQSKVDKRKEFYEEDDDREKRAWFMLRGSSGFA